MNPIISIIIPIFNREKTLHRCIKSVIDQDFSDYECILVDDGSTDKSDEICDKYAREDKRFKVIHKPNGGVSTARNAGLEKVLGEWVFFLDSDDYIEPNHLSSLLNLTTAHPLVDIVICGYKLESNGNRQEFNYKEELCETEDDIIKLLCRDDIMQDTPWMNRMYHSQHISAHHLRFDIALPISEDRLFFYHYMLYANGIACCSNASYIISTDDDASLSKKMPSTEVQSRSIKTHFQASKDLLERFSNNPDLAFSLWKYLWENFHFTIDTLYDGGINLLKVIMSQNKFYDETLDLAFYNKIKDNFSLKQYMSKKTYQDVINKQFLLFDLKKLVRQVGGEKNYMSALIKKLYDFLRRRLQWYIVHPIARRKFQKFNILDSFESIQYIIDNRCSVSRFGDGELRLFYGYDIGFQKTDDKLVKRLVEVIGSDIPNLIIGIPYFLKNVDGTVKATRDFWGNLVKEYGKKWVEYLKEDQLYIDTQISRFYIEYHDYNRSTRQLQMLKQIWQDRDVVIIEGSQSRTGVGNDLYDNARTIERILGFPKNGFAHYDKMLDTIKEHVKPEEEKLLLMSYGPTATILAYDLAKLGYQAVDIGHLDIEYEYYRNKNQEGGVIKGKYNNEAEGGDAVEECNDSEYLSQIICDITK